LLPLISQEPDCGSSSTTGRERSSAAKSNHIGLEVLRKEEGIPLRGARVATEEGREGWRQRQEGRGGEGPYARVPWNYGRRSGDDGSGRFLFLSKRFLPVRSSVLIRHFPLSGGI
jgi:hypothetical protein